MMTYMQLDSALLSEHGGPRPKVKWAGQNQKSYAQEEKELDRCRWNWRRQHAWLLELQTSGISATAYLYNVHSRTVHERNPLAKTVVWSEDWYRQCAKTIRHLDVECALHPKNQPFRRSSTPFEPVSLHDKPSNSTLERHSQAAYQSNRQPGKTPAAPLPAVPSSSSVHELAEKYGLPDNSELDECLKEVLGDQFSMHHSAKEHNVFICSTDEASACSIYENSSKINISEVSALPGPREPRSEHQMPQSKRHQQVARRERSARVAASAPQVSIRPLEGDDTNICGSSPEAVEDIIPS